MVLAHHGKHSSEDSFLGGERSNLKIGLAILVGIVAIAATLAAFAMASARFDIGPRMDPVAYFLLALSAVVLLVIFLVTRIQNETLAGFYVLVTWTLTILSTFLIFRYFG